jgi:hypothetical protein
VKPQRQLNQFSEHRVNGDIEHFISYVPDGDGDKEPALVLAPRNWMLHGRKCYLIPLHCAHQYYPRTLQEKVWVMQHAKMIAICLTGSHLTTPDVLKSIENRLQDLLEAAEYELVRHDRPQETPAVIGEVEVRQDGDLVNVLDLPQDVADYTVETIDHATVH